MFFIMLFVMVLIYICAITLMIKSTVKGRIMNNITTAIYPFYYPFKIKYMNKYYFLEENKGIILFHPEPLEEVTDYKVLENKLEESNTLKLSYAKRNTASDMFAYNYLTFIKEADAPFY